MIVFASSYFFDLLKTILTHFFSHFSFSLPLPSLSLSFTLTFLYQPSHSSHYMINEQEYPLYVVIVVNQQIRQWSFLIYYVYVTQQLHSNQMEREEKKVREKRKWKREKKWKGEKWRAALEVNDSPISEERETLIQIHTNEWSSLFPHFFSLSLFSSLISLYIFLLKKRKKIELNSFS